MARNVRLKRPCLHHRHRRGDYRVWPSSHSASCGGHWACVECARRLARAGERVVPDPYPERLPGIA